MQCLSRLVENNIFSEAILGDFLEQAVESLLKLLCSKRYVWESKPTVRKAAMKLAQAFMFRCPAGDNLDLQRAKYNKEKAEKVLEEVTAAKEARDLLQSTMGDVTHAEEIMAVGTHLLHGLTLTSETVGQRNVFCVHDFMVYDHADPIFGVGSENTSSLMNAPDQESQDLRLRHARDKFREAAFIVTVIDGLEKCLILADSMLTSKDNSDVTEAIETLMVMRDAGMRPANESLAKALQLINRPGLAAEVFRSVMDMFEKVYMSHVSATP